jgi:hypothetical protein
MAKMPFSVSQENIIDAFGTDISDDRWKFE